MGARPRGFSRSPPFPTGLAVSDRLITNKPSLAGRWSTGELCRGGARRVLAIVPRCAVEKTLRDLRRVQNAGPKPSHGREEATVPDEHERFMRAALEQAERAGESGNIAVGSVVVRDHAVISRGRNLVESISDPTAHAEIVALRSAASCLGGVDLSGSTLYTTWEPCPMCLAAILVSRVSTLVMGSRQS